MHYWIQVGSDRPERITAESVAANFGAGVITWDTPACEEGATEWTSIRHLPALVNAIRAHRSARSVPPPVASSVASPPFTPESGAPGLVASQVSLYREIAKQEQYRDQLRAEVELSRQELGRCATQLEELKRDLSSVEEAVDLQSFGFYHPRYGFDSSTEYAARLEQVRRGQEELIKADRATRSEKKWTVDGSAKKGADMARDQSKLMLRAFNGECDAATANVKYNNVENLVKRIEKALAAINKLGLSKHIVIAPEYAALRMEELHLVHEYREKLHEEREAQRAIKEQMKEEQRAELEIQQAVDKAQNEELQKAEALRRARVELEESTGRQHDKLEHLVSRLENELSEALDRKARAIARAQLTRSGHVYVLSNLGCFGADCYKIGMTRRFEPLERVLELGDASVPFHFDVHAMIYSEDAPALERALHGHFADRRVNRVNHRKEFFRVSLDDVRVAVERFHGVVTFVTVPEAVEFRRTRAIDEGALET